MIIQIGSGENLINKVADYLCETTAGRDFSSTAVIFPNRRPSYYLVRRIHEKLNTPFAPPRIFSINEFAGYVAGLIRPGMRIIDDLDKAWLLYEIVSGMKRAAVSGGMSDIAEDFESFFLWGLKIADVIDELEFSDVDDRILRNLRLENVPEKVGMIISNLEKVRRNYYAALSSMNLTTHALNFRVAAERMDKIHLENFERIFLCGIFAPTRLESAILQKIKILKDTVTFVPTEYKRWNADNIRLYSAFDTHSQVKKIGEILSCGFDPAKTLVVIPQPEALIPLLSEVIDRLNVEYNVSLGYPLNRTPVYSFLETAMKLQESRVGGEYYLSDYLSLILHPYIKSIISAGDAKTAVAFEENLSRGLKKPFVTLSEVEGIVLGAAIKEIHETFVRGLENTETFGGLAERFAEMLLLILDKSPIQSHPFSGEYFKKFFDVFENMKSALFKEKKMRIEAVFGLFRYYISGVHIPFSGIPLSGLQILGMLETRNLNFEKVIIMDVNERVIPGTSNRDPLLPESMRKTLGLPTHKEREEIFRRNFMSLVNSASDVHLIYKEHGKDIRSRYVEEIIWEKQWNAKAVADDSAMVEPVAFSIDVKERKPSPIKKNKNTMDILDRLSFSPSSIDTYLNCPARFYFRTILNLREKEDIDRDPDAGKIGDCLHSILEEFYRPFTGREICLAEPERSRLLETAAVKIKDFFGEVRGETYLLAEIIKERLSRFYEAEKLRAGRVLIATEKEMKAVFKIKTGRFVELNGRIDRVDRRGDEIFIIDYKSGGFKIPTKKLSSPLVDRRSMKKMIRSFQLPIYVYMYKSSNPDVPLENINAAFYSLKEIEEKNVFDGGLSGEMLEKVFMPSLDALLTEIFDPAAVFFERDDEDETYCKNCPYGGLCSG